MTRSGLDTNSKPKDDSDVPNRPRDFLPLKVRGRKLERSGNEYKIYGGNEEPIASLSGIEARLYELCDGHSRFSTIVNNARTMQASMDAITNEEIYKVFESLREMNLLVFSGAIPPSENGTLAFTPKTFHCNRGNLIHEIMKEWDWRPARQDEVAEFSMWDSKSDKGIRIGKHQCYEPFQTYEISCKRRMYENLCASAHQDITPECFLSIEDFLASGGTKGELWFLKLSFSTYSRDVYCYDSNAEIEDKVSSFRPSTYIIQKGVTDLVLSQNRKFSLRVYVALIAGETYVHQNAQEIMHSSEYNPYDTSRIVQLPDHHTSLGIMVNYAEYYPDLFDQIKSSAKITIESIKDSLESTGDTSCYQFFGFDYLISKSRGAVLIEVNDWPTTGYPNTSLTDPAERIQKKNVIRDLLSLTIYNEPGDFIFTA